MLISSDRLRALAGASTLVALAFVSWALFSTVQPKTDLPPAIVSSLHFAFEKGPKSWAELPFQDRVEFRAALREILQFDELLQLTGPFRSPVRIEVDMQRPYLYSVRPDQIRLGRDVFAAEGQMRRALIRAWMHQSAGPSNRNEILENLKADLVLLSVDGNLSYRIPGLSERPDTGAVQPWPNSLMNQKELCASIWQPLEQVEWCRSYLRMKTVRSLQDAVGHSGRPLAVAALARSVEGLSVVDRLRFLREWSEVFRVDPSNRSGSAEPEPAGDAMGGVLQKDWVKSDPGVSIVTGQSGGDPVLAFETLREFKKSIRRDVDEALQINRLGFMREVLERARGQAFKDLSLDESPSETFDLFLDIRETVPQLAREHLLHLIQSRSGRTLRVLIRQNEQLTLGASGLHLSGQADPRLHIPMAVVAACEPVTVGDLTSLPLMIRRVLVVPLCEPDASPDLLSYGRKGIDGFLSGDQTTPFVLIHRPSLEVQMRRGLAAHTAVLSLDLNLPEGARVFPSVEWTEGARETDPKLHAIRIKGPLTAVEWYRPTPSENGH